MGVRAQPHGVDLVFGFVVDPHVDGILRKDIAFQQEVLICLQCFQGFFERSRSGSDFSQLFRRQVVDVFVQRITRVDLVLDPVQHRHHQG